MNKPYFPQEPVLIVDDQSKNRFAFRQTLRLAGIPSVEVTSGTEALRFLLNQQVSLILLDIQMPGMNGFETAQFIRQNPDYQEVPILFITATYRSDDFADYGYSVGAYDYLTKPVDNRLLVSKVKLFRALYFEKQELRQAHQQLQWQHEQLKAVKTQAFQTAKLVALGKLATGVAHEINNPLTFVNSMLEDWSEELQEAEEIDRKELQADLRQGLLQTKRIAKIVRHLMVFGRGEDGTHGAADLKVVLANSRMLIGEQLREQGVDFEVDLPEGLPFLQGSLYELEQLLLNLLHNALEAFDPSADRKMLRLTAQVEPDGSWVTLRIQDNGPGIAEETLSKIFDPFFTTKDIGRGAGLGLAVSHGLARAMGGSITCESSGSTGTTFSVTLPVAEPFVRRLEAEEALSEG